MAESTHGRRALAACLPQGVPTGPIRPWCGRVRAVVGPLVLACVLLLPGSPARAEVAKGSDEALMGMGLEQLLQIPVYAASRHEQKSSEAPASVTVVTSAEIRRHGWRTLADLLQSVRGFYATYDRAYGYIGVRGFAMPGDLNTKVLFLVDGHRVNDDLYDQGYVGEDFLVDLDLVDRVEVVRGPSSCLYGSDAFFAVVNVITRDGRNVKGFESAAESGSHDSRRGRLTLGQRLGDKADVLLSGSLFHRDAQKFYFPELDFPANNNGVVSNLGEEESQRAFARLHYHNLTLEAAEVLRTNHDPTAGYGSVFPDSASRQQDEAYFVDARFDGGYGGWSTAARVSLNQYRCRERVTMDNPGIDPMLPDRFPAGSSGIHRTFGSELKIDRTIARHTATVGGEYRDVFLERQQNFITDPYISVMDVNRPSNIWALFAQDEVRVSSRLLVDAGLRHDHYSTFGGTTNPRGAIIWFPEAATSVKLLYGQAFRAPNAYELYWNDSGATQKGNPNLRPERIQTQELVLEREMDSAFSAVASAYDYQIQNLINVTTDTADGLNYYSNLGQVRAWGCELELVGKWRGGLQAKMDGSVQRAEDEQTGAVLPNSPHWIGGGDLLVPLIGRKVSAGWEVRFVSTREPMQPSHQTPARGYALSNLTLSARDLIRGVTASATVYNLFNAAYADLGDPQHVQELIPQNGRTYRLKLAYAL